MGVEHRLKYEIRQRLKEALREEPEIDSLLGRRREAVFKKAGYWLDENNLQKRENNVLDSIAAMHTSPRATYPMLPLWTKKYPKIRAIAAYAKRKGIPSDKALELMIRKGGPEAEKRILDAVARAGMTAEGLATDDGSIVIENRYAENSAYGHELAHQVRFRSGLPTTEEAEEAFADVIGKDGHVWELSKYKANGWANHYGSFSRTQYILAHRVLKWAKQKYGIRVAYALTPILGAMLAILPRRPPKR